MKILIVDDNDDNLAFLETLLRKSGYEVVSSRNGVEALEKLKNNTIDMIVSDVLMPVMDGFQFCRECKKDDSLMRIPFVFYTATYTDKKDEEFALSLGAEKFIVKPCEINELLRILKDVIEAAPVASEISINNEETYLAKYNKRLVEKLENKVLDLEKEVDKRKQDEETLRESEEKYRRLVESANDAIFVADAETGIIIDVNKRAEQMIGLPAEKIIGMHQSLLHPPEEAEHYKKIFEDHINTGRIISNDLFVCNKDGRKIPVEISASITEMKGRKIIQGIFRDITERRRMDEALRFSTFAIDNNADATYLVKSDAKISYANKAACQSLEYSYDELTCIRVPDIAPDFPDESWPAHWQKMKEAGTLTFEAYHKTKAGPLAKNEESRHACFRSSSQDQGRLCIFCGNPIYLS